MAKVTRYKYRGADNPKEGHKHGMSPNDFKTGELYEILPDSICNYSELSGLFSDAEFIDAGGLVGVEELRFFDEVEVEIEEKGGK